MKQFSKAEIDQHAHEKPQELLDYAFNIQRSGNFSVAEQIYDTVLKNHPTEDRAFHLKGILGFQRGDYKKAIRFIKQAIEIDDSKSFYHNDIGASYYAEGLLEQAIYHYEESIKLVEKAETYSNLGEAIKGKGEIEQAMECYQKALELKPDFTPGFSNLLLNSNYSTKLTKKEIFDYHVEWGKKFANEFSKEEKIFENSLSLDRKIKVGYISPDFCDHSVAWFMKNLIKHHDREKFEIYCYANVQMQDKITQYFIEHSDHWMNITSLDHEKTAAFIQLDEIDILFDLTGHTVSNRLLTLARRPAPIQISYLGYPNTFGLKAINYRVVDNYTDPQGLTDAFHIEELIRLPHSFLCYHPPEHSPAIHFLPAIKNKSITFGCFNNNSKINTEVIETWSKILKGVPNSRLALKSRNLEDKKNRDSFLEKFKKFDVDPGRIGILGHVQDPAEHLNMYNQVDIALDPFPYNGTATSCESLWMGVPFITLVGDSHVSRVGYSLLKNTGLDEFITNSKEEYVEKAISFAENTEHLRKIRGTMRARLKSSSLLNAKQHTKEMEEALIKIFNVWVETQKKEK